MLAAPRIRHACKEIRAVVVSVPARAVNAVRIDRIVHFPLQALAFSGCAAGSRFAGYAGTPSHQVNYHSGRGLDNILCVVTNDGKCKIRRKIFGINADLAYEITGICAHTRPVRYRELLSFFGTACPARDIYCFTGWIIELYPLLSFITTHRVWQYLTDHHVIRNAACSQSYPRCYHHRRYDRGT